MGFIARPALQRLLRYSVVAVAAAAASTGAVAALSPFTLNAGAFTGGTTFTGDNILVSDYSTITFNGLGGFTDTGFLAVSAVQNGGSTFTPSGLNSTYGLYFAFSGTGTTTVANPALAPTFGSFTSMTYTLYGYNGTASFGFSGNTPTETAVGEVVLATGTLINGAVGTLPSGNGITFTPSANADLTFSALNPAFFVAPSPFYGMAITAFTNTTSEVEPFANGFRIRQGGGSLNFAAPIPEPETYALMLAGLAAMSFVVRRRTRKAAA